MTFCNNRILYSDHFKDYLIRQYSQDFVRQGVTEESKDVGRSLKQTNLCQLPRFFPFSNFKPCTGVIHRW